MKRTIPLVTILLLSSGAVSATIGADAVRLRNLGLAELENEQPGKAEVHFRELSRLVPRDPLPDANLAISNLRQQKFEEALTAIERALERAPGEARLLAIKGEILQWSGRPEAALSVFRTAADRAPENVEIQYALLRQASSLTGDEADRFNTQYVPAAGT